MEENRQSITRTARFKLFPDEEVKKELSCTVYTYRDGCRLAADYIYENRELRRVFLHEALYPILRAPDGFALPSQMAESVIKTAVLRTKAVIQINRDWGKPVFHNPVCELVYERDYTIWEEWISVRTLKKRMKIPYCKTGMEAYLNREWKPGTAKLFQKGVNWYINIPMTKEVQVPKVTSMPCVVGCDYGINFLITAYDSNGKTRFYSGREVKKHHAEYLRVMDELKEKHTKSAKRRMKALTVRENGYLSDVCHRTAKALVNSYPPGSIFVTERINHGHRIKEFVTSSENPVEVSLSFAELREKIAYRAEERGGRLLEVEPAYSSQKCPKCGTVRKTNRNKRIHTYHCAKCGYESNDDRIGAMNLYERGVEALREESSVTKMCEEPHQVYRQDGIRQALCQGAKPAVPGSGVAKKQLQFRIESPVGKQQSRNSRP